MSSSRLERIESCGDDKQSLDQTVQRTRDASSVPSRQAKEESLFQSTAQVGPPRGYAQQESVSMARSKRVGKKQTTGTQRTSRRSAQGEGVSGEDFPQDQMEIDPEQAAANEDEESDEEDPQEDPAEEEDAVVGHVADGGGGGGDDDGPSSSNESDDEDEDQAGGVPRAGGGAGGNDPFAEGGAYYIDPLTSQVLALLVRIGINRVMATRLMHQENMMRPEDLLLRYDDAISTACSQCVKKAPAGFMNTISGLSQDMLKLACHQVRFLANTSRPLNLHTITKEVLTRMKVRRDKLKKHRNDDVTPPEVTERHLKPEEADKTWSQIKEYLANLRDDQGIPLLGYVRPTDKLFPKDSDDDPSTMYPNHDKELIARVPICKPGYVPAGTGQAVDEMISRNAAYKSEQFRAADSVLYTALHSLLSERNVWAHAGPAARMMLGRTAFWNIHRGMFGANISTFRLKQLDARMAKLTYKGEQKRYNFQKYVENHQDINNQRNIIIREGTNVPTDVVAWSGHTRVSKLLAGISPGVIDAPLAQITGDPARRNDFIACIEYVQTWINEHHPQDEGGARNRNVSQVGSRKRGNGGPKNNGGKKKAKNGDSTDVSQAEIDRQTHIQDKQYSAKEYAAFTKAERAYLYQLRQKKKNADNRAVAEMQASTRDMQQAREELRNEFSGDRRSRGRSRSRSRDGRPSSCPPEGGRRRSRSESSGSRGPQDEPLEDEEWGRRRHGGGTWGTTW